MEETGVRHEVGTAYDGVAELYNELYGGRFEPQEPDRGMLVAFAERARGRGSVIDAGCGPGHVTAYLNELGLDASGLDLSPAMIDLARHSWPDLRFETGTMNALPAANGTLAGIVARYSIIHTPPDLVPPILREFHRALSNDAHLLISFQATDQATTPFQPFDHKVVLAYRWSPDHLAKTLTTCGFNEIARLVRTPADNERFPQATLLLQKPHP